MKRIIFIGLLALIMAVSGIAIASVPVPEPSQPTKIVTIGPTPLDDQIQWAIDHADQ